MISNSNSPQFITLLGWLNDNNFEKISKWSLFPLKDPDTWIKKKHNYYSRIDLSKIRKELDRDLIDPLFKREGINVKYEADPYEHREDNLYCCFEAALKDLEAIKGKNYDEFDRVLYRLRSDCQKIAREAFKPFSLFLNPPEENLKGPNTLRREYEALEEERDRIAEKMEELLKERVETIVDLEKFMETEKIFENGYREKDKEMEEIYRNYIRSKRKYSFNKIEDAENMIKNMLSYLKNARGKPGRPPKPFNAFVYHLINKCTSWKLDKDRNYVYRKDGQHKFERDWKLINYLLLDSYIRHPQYFPEIEEFISKNKKTPAKEALRELTKKLRDIYSNFPRKDGWPFQKRIYKTGFRKLIIKDKKLAIVRL